MRFGVRGSVLRAYGSRVWGLREQGLGFREQVLGLREQDFGCREQGFGFTMRIVHCLVFGYWSLRFGVRGGGF